MPYSAKVPKGSLELDEDGDDLLDVVASCVPEPSHTALLPIDADEYESLVLAKINIELDLLVWCAQRRYRDS